MAAIYNLQQQQEQQQQQQRATARVKMRQTATAAEFDISTNLTMDLEGFEPASETETLKTGNIVRDTLPANLMADRSGGAWCEGIRYLNCYQHLKTHQNISIRTFNYKNYK